MIRAMPERKRFFFIEAFPNLGRRYIGKSMYCRCFKEIPQDVHFRSTVNQQFNSISGVLADPVSKIFLYHHVFHKTGREGRVI